MREYTPLVVTDGVSEEVLRPLTTSEIGAAPSTESRVTPQPDKFQPCGRCCNPDYCEIENLCYKSPEHPLFSCPGDPELEAVAAKIRAKREADRAQPDAGTLAQREIDIKNLRFYSAMAHDFKWQTDIIHWSVVSQTLKQIADRLASSPSPSATGADKV